MASSNLDSYSTGESYNDTLNIHIEEGKPVDILPTLEVHTSSVHHHNKNIPKPPTFPETTLMRKKYFRSLIGCSVVPEVKQITWDKMFKEAYEADIYIITDNESIIPAHSYILSMASSVLLKLLQQSKVRTNGIRYIKIPGVSSEAVYTFTRFLYSSCYDKEEMKKCVLPLLVLSHCYSVPTLKRVSVNFMEQGWLTTENVIDVLQLAKYCDAPRLRFVCARMVVQDFKTISSTEGWKVMRQANPELEQELVELVVEEDSRKEKRSKKREEKMVYMQLHQAMEALLHIYRDGCRTIGPRDKILKGSQVACGFPACKGVESLVRHFSICKTRVPGGCVHCKRMWQLLELHSRMCEEPDSCEVPLCRHFKERVKVQSKRAEAKWKILVVKVIAAKNALGPFSSMRKTAA